MIEIVNVGSSKPATKRVIKKNEVINPAATLKKIIGDHGGADRYDIRNLNVVQPATFLSNVTGSLQSGTVRADKSLGFGDRPIIHKGKPAK